MNNTLITIIIPCYNVEKYICRTIESMEKQEKMNFEAIFIDDGSTDNTMKKLEEKLCTVKFTYKIIHQENKGVSAARNVGIEEANGIYIYFLDGDDTIEPDLTLILEEEIKGTKADILYFGYDHVRFDNSTIRPVEDVFKYSKYCMNGKDGLKSMLKGQIHICAISGIYSKELINSHNIRYTVGATIGEDEEFTCKALYFAERVCAVDKLLSHYLKREGANFQPNEKQLHRFQSKMRLYEYLKNVGADTETLEILKHYNIPFSTMVSLVILAKSTFNEKRLLEMLKDKVIRENLGQYRGSLFCKEDLKFKIKALLAVYFPKRFIIAFRLKHKSTH